MSTSGSALAIERLARILGVALVAAPALWLAGALAAELLSDLSGPFINTAFHVVLIVAALVAGAEFAASVTRAKHPSVALALGLIGVAAIALGALATEILGPPVLLLLIIAEALVAVRLVRSSRHTPGLGDPVPA
ncbi:MAG: hypothetical protein ACYC2X_03670 [Coriobacteriia bacterium]